MNEKCTCCNKEFPKIKGLVPIKVLYNGLWICGACYGIKTQELMEAERTKNNKVVPMYRLPNLGTEKKRIYDYFK